MIMRSEYVVEQNRELQKSDLMWGKVQHIHILCCVVVC